MNQNTPREIIANKIVRILSITWNDEHVSHYPFNLLRAGCPCAVCRGGHENMRSEPDPAVFNIQLPDSPATELVNVEAVGSYAISLLWNDGHHEGIYSWNYLRALCPCDECRSD
jgi:DUF971 family protein